MATVAHIIRSYYDPADREQLERETGQHIDDESDAWHTQYPQRRTVRAPPTFVPATLSYDEWGVPLPTTSPTVTKHVPASASTAEWYRALTTTAAATRPDTTDAHRPPAEAPIRRPSSAPTSARRPRPSSPLPSAPLPTRSDWFATHHRPRESESESLADILARDPPPQAPAPRFVPPVWLHIGPSNRGFGMLQRRGWREGEGLGPAPARGAASGEREDAPEIVDLTLSDSDADSDADVDAPAVVEAHREAGSASDDKDPSPSHASRSLLTPLPTVLKADRLGIGLKAKTEGPHRQSKKRVTHNAAALAAHIRAAEETRRHKAIVGRGKRGFAKAHRQEEDRRKAMLAYLNQ